VSLLEYPEFLLHRACSRNPERHPRVTAEIFARPLFQTNKKRILFISRLNLKLYYLDLISISQAQYFGQKLALEEGEEENFRLPMLNRQ
jgi:hypothetical protein